MSAEFYTVNAIKDTEGRWTLVATQDIVRSILAPGCCKRVIIKPRCVPWKTPTSTLPVPREISDWLDENEPRLSRNKVWLRIVDSSTNVFRLAASRDELIELRQKNTEWFDLISFSAIVGLDPCTVTASERPDFLVDEDKIGIEYTGFFSSAGVSTERPFQEVEKRWQSLSHVIATEKATRLIPDTIEGTLIFRQADLPPRKKDKAFVAQLLAFVECVLPEISSEPQDFGQFSAEHTLLTKYLTALRLRKGEAACLSWGWNYQAGFLGLTDDKLLSTISGKLSPCFEHQTDEYWLLVAGGGTMSKRIFVPGLEVLNSFDKSNKALRESPYERAYLFEYIRQRVWLWDREDGWTGPLQENDTQGSNMERVREKR